VVLDGYAERRMLQSCTYMRGPGRSSRWRPRLGPTLEHTQALCGPCVSRTGLFPPVCGRHTRAELHIQDIGSRMLPSSAALRRGASCRHPCCSFPCNALGAHGTLHRPVCGKHLRALCTTNLEVRQMLTHPSTFRNYTLSEPRYRALLTEDSAERLELSRA
jgi:hypothetical protein